MPINTLMKNTRYFILITLLYLIRIENNTNLIFDKFVKLFEKFDFIFIIFII